jgi:transcriptional regulator with XRE-family HTH domain
MKQVLSPDLQFIERIKLIRKTLGLSAKDVDRLVGQYLGNTCKIEKGYLHMSLPNAYALMQQLTISIHQLMGDLPLTTLTNTRPIIPNWSDEMIQQLINRIVPIRETMGMSQLQFSKFIGCESIRRIGRIELGSLQLSLEDAYSICKKCNLTIQ